jgi:hypothetical protein
VILHALEIDEFVRFFRQGKKIKAEGVSDRFNSRCCVGESSQDLVSGVEVSGAAVFVTPHIPGVDILTPEKKIQQDSCACPGLAVHNHHVLSAEV